MSEALAAAPVPAIELIPLPPAAAVPQADDSPVGWLVKQAESALKDSDFDRASAYFEKMLVLARGKPELLLFGHLRLASLHAARRDYAKLKRHFLKAIALDPDDAELRFRLGEAVLALGKRREAVAAFRSAVERAPQVAEYHRRYAEGLLRLGRHDDAEAAFRRALAVEPNDLPLLRGLALLLIERDAFAEAEEFLRKALSLAPGDKELLSTFSLLQFTRKPEPKPLPSSAPLTKKTRLKHGDYTHVVVDNVEWIEDEDRHQAYKSYCKAHRDQPLTFPQWLTLDEEMLCLLFWSSLRDLAPAEAKRLAELEQQLRS